jgi:uncharacterized protein YdaU (DUF1376 family)
MAIELSRMDFHVTRFMESEDVEEMDASEVGQYCLLLFKAWQLAKDASLPVEVDKLSRYARVSEVSQSVLRKFPIVDTEWGKRRRNDVQFGVWKAARARSQSAKRSADMRWGYERNANASESHEPEECEGNAIPEHTIPSIPDQAEQNGTKESPALSPIESLADKWSNK